jgi:Family of unknown function (DUF6232)
MDLSEIFSQAQNLIQNNQIKQARALLRETTKQFPNNEQAWVLTSYVTETVEQAIYCLQQAIKINPESQIAQILLNQTERTGFRPSIAQPSSKVVPAKSEPPTTPRQPVINMLSYAVSSEKIYYHDNLVFVSNTRIAFNQNTVPISQIISFSYDVDQPILSRIFGVLFLLLGISASVILFIFYSSVTDIVSWESLFNNSKDISSMLFGLSPIPALFAFLIVLILLLGLILLFTSKDKYIVNIKIPTGDFPIAISKNQKYTAQIAGAINKALIERGPYISSSRQYQGGDGTGSSIVSAWAILFAFLIGIALIVAGAVCLFIIAPQQIVCNKLFTNLCQPTSTYYPVIYIGLGMCGGGISGIFTTMVGIVKRL